MTALPGWFLAGVMTGAALAGLTAVVMTVISARRARRGRSS